MFTTCIWIDWDLSTAGVGPNLHLPLQTLSDYGPFAGASVSSLLPMEHRETKICQLQVIMMAQLLSLGLARIRQSKVITKVLGGV